MTKALPHRDDLIKLIDYDPSTGKLFWKERQSTGESTRADLAAIRFNSLYAGKETFCLVNPRGYYWGKFLGTQYLAHRIIWKMVTGTDPDVIDHINGDRIDNRFINLRNVDGFINQRNRRAPKHNESGVFGVTLCRATGKWAARIHKNRERFNLGRFDSLGEAIAARRNAEIEYWGDDPCRTAGTTSHSAPRTE